MRRQHSNDEPTHAGPTSRWRAAAPGWLLLLLVPLAAFVALLRHEPPSPVGASAPPSVFSSERAMRHVEALAQRPRPIGSAAHDEARDYLVRELSALGLSPGVRKSDGVSRRFGQNIFLAATVENVAARLPGGGGGGGKALLLVAHYDSVPTAPGAADDASGAAILLETARALKSETPLRNDVIFLFTDGEETGLFGAKAFVEEHPWAKDVGVALNFEARGNGGPSVMFETSPGNERLIGEFADSAPHPVANSLTYEIYKQLPNSTDFSVIKQKNVAGLNFAYIRGFTHYHTMIDTPSNLDARSLQHQGSSALALARHFGSIELANLGGHGGGAADAVYFDVLGARVVHYPASWALPLAALAALLFAVVVILGFKNRHLSALGVVAGFAVTLASLVLTPLAVWSAWWLTGALQTAFGIDPQAAVCRQDAYLLGLVLVSAAVPPALFLLARRISAQDLAVGGLLWWLLPTILTSLLVPGSSYLFLWPMCFSLVALGWLFGSKTWDAARPKRLAVLALCALPGIILLAPVIQMIFTALGFAANLVVAVFVALLCASLTPHLKIISAARAWLLPAGAAAAGAALLLGASYATSFTAECPRPSNLFYALNGNAGTAVWASAYDDDGPDAWAAQYLTAGAAKGALADYVPQRHGNFVSHAAPPSALAPPSIELLGDATADGVRTLRLRVTSPRQAPVMTVYMDSEVRVRRASVDGRKIDDGEPAAPSEDQPRWRLNYYGFPKQGVELTLEVEEVKPLKIWAMDQSYGLPEIPGASDRPRPAWVKPAPWRLYSDQTLVDKAFIF